jgi:hypothetical protein
MSLISDTEHPHLYAEASGGTMAIDKPAKAPPLYEGGHDKSTDVPGKDFFLASSLATRQSGWIASLLPQ